jgi:two-component system nitrogen regulation response regulator NtrX
METLWIVDDDAAILERLRAILTREGYHVETAASPDDFLARAAARPPAVAILDICFPGSRTDGEDLVKTLTERFPNAQAVMMSGESDVQKTLACLRQGALDFLEKPVSLARLLTSVRNAFSLYNARSSARAQHTILGHSAATQRVNGLVHKLATLNESVLILGESGTGKELVAVNLHLYSPRCSLPIQKVNCAALNPNLIEAELFGYKKGSFTGALRDHKGYFEAAHGSTLFIDEVGDFAAALQSRILRVLQEKTVTPVGATREIPVDARLVFATHRNLEEMVARGEFREDLYFRLSTFVIELPPLRERLEDIDDLAPHFLAQFLDENNLPSREFSPDAVAKLKQHDYPGNIRELAKIVKNAAFFCTGDRVTADDIDFHPRAGGTDIWVQTRAATLREARCQFERELIQRRLRATGGDMEQTAAGLGLLRTNLYRKMRSLGLDPRG